jgi:hypothetical protein
MSETLALFGGNVREPKPGPEAVPMNRRALLSVGALSCFSAMTATAFAQLRANATLSGKPLLTIDNLNAAIPPLNDPRRSAVLLEAARDPRSFVRSRFTLSPAQEVEIVGISAANMAALQQTLRTAASQNRPITFSMVARVINNGAVSPQCLLFDKNGICVTYATQAPTAVGVRPPVSGPPLPAGTTPSITPH